MDEWAAVGCECADAKVGSSLVRDALPLVWCRLLISRPPFSSPRPPCCLRSPFPAGSHLPPSLLSPPLPPPLHSIPTDVSFGLIGGTGVVSAAQERTPQYALLAAPTPGRENSGPRPGGPLIIGCACRVDRVGMHAVWQRLIGWP